MKLSKFAAAALGASALALLSAGAQAANVVDFAAAGSSAQFTTFTAAFLAQGYNNHYTKKSSANFQVAPAVPGITAEAGVPNENAQVAIYWKGTAPNLQIAVFYQVDSTVGVRAFFNNDTLTTPAVPGAPDNVGITTGDVALDNDVRIAVNGTPVNIGATDITPEDARVATERAINLGYGPSSPIVSAVNALSQADPVRFSITSKPFILKQLGAVPVVVFVNKGPNFSALSGANLNIDSFQLAGFLSGQFNRVGDLNYDAANSQAPVHTYVREPLSGTYNTIEYTNAEAQGLLNFTGGLPSGNTAASGGQELNVASNPLNEPSSGLGSGPGNSGRIRAIGTGELIGAVNGDATDALGYAFYSAGSFTAAKANKLTYLTVNGADPLLDNYAGGNFPVTASFRNVANGGYPLWSILRVIEPASPSSTVIAIVNSAVGAASGADFVPSSALRVFRSYHATPFTVGAAANGNQSGKPANGGDVGGAVFSINNDKNNIADFGSGLTNLRQ